MAPPTFPLSSAARLRDDSGGHPTGSDDRNPRGLDTGGTPLSAIELRSVLSSSHPVSGKSRHDLPVARAPHLGTAPHSDQDPVTHDCSCSGAKGKHQERGSAPRQHAREVQHKRSPRPPASFHVEPIRPQGGAAVSRATAGSEQGALGRNAGTPRVALGAGFALHQNSEQSLLRSPGAGVCQAEQCQSGGGPPG